MNIYEEIETAYGNHFEDLFSNLMKSKYGKDYQPTSAYGNKGDFKVDGVLHLKIAFAIYGPESYNDQATLKKIKADFEGFLKKRKEGVWKSIEKYVFVIKGHRDKVTSSVLNYITEINRNFPVELMTMDDIKLLCFSARPFSNDGDLLEELKKDVTIIMEYIRDTDFLAEPFHIEIVDKIEIGILQKWNKKRYRFSDEKNEILKNNILVVLNELCEILNDSKVHLLADGEHVMFDNNTWELGVQLREILPPIMHSIRYKVAELIEELYKKK